MSRRWSGRFLKWIQAFDVRRTLRAWFARLAPRRETAGAAAMIVTAVASLAFIVLLVHRAVYHYVTSSPQFLVPRATARIRVAPRWADPRSSDNDVFLDVGGRSLFDPDLVRTVAAAFEQNPWVRRLTAVDRVFPDQLRVRFEPRRPRLSVRKSNGVVLVDREGTRLPGHYAECPAFTLEVVGTAAGVPAPGGTWGGDEIKIALEMADLIEREPLLRALAVHVLDLSNLDGRRDARQADLALKAGAGAWIWWGRAPSRARYGEPSLVEKLDNLRMAAENYPQLDGLSLVKIHQKGPPRCTLREDRLGRDLR
ncbi:MAG: hypothetical protein HY716_04975 [Planctomycetes bacterium]|nr:hypothetical protein [Planctomycetota bacterium]